MWDQDIGILAFMSVVSAGSILPLTAFWSFLVIIDPNFPILLATIYFKAGGTNYGLWRKLQSGFADQFANYSGLSPLLPLPSHWLLYSLWVQLVFPGGEAGRAGQDLPECARLPPCCRFCYPDCQGHLTKKKKVQNGYHIKIFLDT